jgi:hypothetical protein
MFWPRSRHFVGPFYATRRNRARPPNRVCGVWASAVANMRWTTLVLLACSAAVEALHLASPLQRASAGAAKPRIATASTMRLDIIPLCDSTSPGFIATRFIVPALAGSVVAGIVRRPVAKLVVGVVSLLLSSVLCVPAARTKPLLLRCAPPSRPSTTHRPRPRLLSPVRARSA